MAMCEAGIEGEIIEELKALLTEALDDRLVRHAEGCSARFTERAMCKCGFREWSIRAIRALVRT